MPDTFQKVARLDEIAVGGCHTLRAGGCPIAVFRPSTSELYAIENRCPHEGYPLSTGRVDGDRLTCEWHNWKFQLADGACLIGGEAVRTFPIRVDGDDVWLDVSPPAPYMIVEAEHASLDKAFEEGDFGHAARAVQRLLVAGESAPAILAFGVSWAAQRVRYGFDHGLAAAPDLAQAIVENPAEADQYLVDAFELMVQPNLRLPLREVAQAGERADESTLRNAIETESLGDVERIVRAECGDEAGARRVIAWLLHAATDHFLDYGHAHIYTVKAEELLETIGFEHADVVLPALAARIVYGTREDSLPYMRSFQKMVAPIFADTNGLFEATTNASFDVDGVVAAVVDGSLDDAVTSVHTALTASAAPDQVALALALGASHRMLRFDAQLETDPASQEGWLDITHALTHADAVHRSVVRHPSPENLRGLFHSARFIQHLAVLDSPAPPPFDRAVTGAEVLAKGLGGHAVLPIFAAHHIKTSRAAVRLNEALANAFPERADHDLPLCAARRFLESPLGERRIRQRVLTARTFVREGKMPHRRLGY